MKKNFLVIVFLSFTIVVIAQINALKTDGNKVVLTKVNTQWTFESYGDYIIKTTIKNSHEKNSEQISNAVILKPSLTKPVISVADTKTIGYGKSISLIISSKAVEYIHGATKITSTGTYLNTQYKGVTFAIADSTEQFYGAGERALPQNRRGKKLVLYNNPWYGYEYGADNLNYSVPFIMSSKGYAIFFDNPSKGYFDIGLSNPNVLEAAFVSGELTYYIVFGKNADEILQHYQQLVGTQPIPPRWAMGNFISRFGYRSQAQADAVVQKMKEEQFPADGIILDLFWFGDSIQRTLGNLDWVNKTKWPNPKKMIADWRKQNLKTVIITEPFILKNTRTYNESLKYHAVDSLGNPFTLTDFYFGYGGIVDVFRKDAQEWFKKVYRTQTANGVSGWWTDLGEPEKHPSNLYHNLKDLGFKRLFKADEVHNIFGHYWNKMLFDFYTKEHPNTRLFHLNRSGYAGSPRYSIFPWTGDISRSWNGLKAQLPVILGMNLSGIPYTHSDAGGFTTTYNKDAELYTRWLELSTFTPIFRPHAAALGDLNPPGSLEVPSEPALWDEPTKSIARNLIQLRYNLTPYNYTLAYQQFKNGKLLVRPMFYESFADSNLLKADEQFMWGDNILVAPVIKQGAVTKDIYFPKGKWYDFVRNKYYEGGQWVTDSADLNEIPFFIKEGGFIPMVSGFNTMDKYNTSNLSILYFPSSEKTFYEMYDDDGLTNNAIVKKQFELLQMSGQVKDGEIKIEVKSNGGNFIGRPAKRTLRISIAGIMKLPSSVIFNNKLIKVMNAEEGGMTEWKPGTALYLADKKTVSVLLEFSGKPLQIKVSE
ncbi:MAG: glycoside hydrolase family 31 protein [Sphingobacteriales bacterium]|nr:MAG: glycoside hydrolase family 31 protein [Sphingobacteriales bacterium]